MYKVQLKLHFFTIDCEPKFWTQLCNILIDWWAFLCYSSTACNLCWNPTRRKKKELRCSLFPRNIDYTQVRFIIIVIQLGRFLRHMNQKWRHHSRALSEHHQLKKRVFSTENRKATEIILSLKISLIVNYLIPSYILSEKECKQVVALCCVQTWCPSTVPENDSWWALVWTHLNSKYPRQNSGTVPVPEYKVSTLYSGTTWYLGL